MQILATLLLVLVGALAGCTASPPWLPLASQGAQPAPCLPPGVAASLRQAPRTASQVDQHWADQIAGLPGVALVEIRTRPTGPSAASI